MLVEDGTCGVGVSGEPVKVFLGELLKAYEGTREPACLNPGSN